MDTKASFDILFSSMKTSPLEIDTFKTIRWWICENNVTDELKMILLSHESLDAFRLHLKNWKPEKYTKALIENLKLILVLSDKLPELHYRVLLDSGYFTEVLSIFYSCLRYLKERKQNEIDENCSLSIVLSNVSKYALKFCLKDTKNITLSCVGQLFFKEALHFLKHKSFEFARNPNNCVYALILTNTINSVMSQFSAYKSLFVELDGIKYCLDWLSNTCRSKGNFFQKLYYDLRILSILENFVDDPYFIKHKQTIALRLIKYLRCNGEQILSTTFMPESYLVFNCLCSILIKMSMKIPGSRQDICAHKVKQLLLSFLNKYRTCTKAIYTTLLTLEEITETGKSSETMDTVVVYMSKLEALSNVLLLSNIYGVF